MERYQADLLRHNLRRRQRGLAASAWANYDMVLSEDATEAARNAFLARYPDLAAWMARSYAQSNRHGGIAIGRLGRVIEAGGNTHSAATAVITGDVLTRMSSTISTRMRSSAVSRNPGAPY